MTTGRQHMMVWFAAGTGQRPWSATRSSLSWRTRTPPHGIWLTAGLVVWILSSDGLTRRLRDLLQAWRGSSGQPPGAGDSHPRPDARCQPRSAAAALALVPQAVPSPGSAMFMTALLGK
jgi:hypothetical protein